MKKPWQDHEKEKRNQPRLDLDGEVEVHKEKFGGSQQGRIHDISTKGIRISTELTFNENEDVVLHLQNPHTQEHVTLIGEVCWMEDTSESRVQAGISFHPLDGHSLAKLKELMQQASGTQNADEKSSSHFANAPSLEKEISKILARPDTQDETENPDGARSIQEEADTPVDPTLVQQPPSQVQPGSSKGVRFLTLLLFLVLVGLAGATWWLQQQNEEALTFSKAKEAVSVIIRDGGWLEQDLKPDDTTTPPPAIPDPQIAEEPAVPNPVVKTNALEGEHSINSAQGIQTIAWSGPKERLTLNISFDQLPSGLSYQIQKLDFDPNNLRYLIKLPLAQSKLAQNEFALTHPLVEQIRVGIHALETGPSLHLVLDMKKARGEIVADRIVGNQLLLELVSFQ
jgi:Tfp pilus assembly protein PilZ